MNNKYGYLVLGIFITGQFTYGFMASNDNSKKIQSKLESIQYQEINKKLETQTYSNAYKVRRTTYRYEKRKDFHNIQNNVAMIQEQYDFGGDDSFGSTYPGQIARAISGKLLFAATN